MKVGFHVYLMPWFAQPCVNVDGNEDWHVENRLWHSSPPQVLATVGAESSPISQLLPPALVITSEQHHARDSGFFSMPCVRARFRLYFLIKLPFIKVKPMVTLRAQHNAVC